MQPATDSSSSPASHPLSNSGQAAASRKRFEDESGEFVVASVQEVRDRWSRFVELVRTTGRSVLVTHMRKPVAALISLHDLELLESWEARRRKRPRFGRWR